ncbi:MAG: hypothetical protein V4550_09220 [Gemmatimonadota bacterium]
MAHVIRATANSVNAMTPGARKAVLTAHVISSVGWLGAVAAFLVLSIAGLTTRDGVVVRSAYVSMNLVGLYTIVPMSLVSVVTGIWIGLGTEWGLRRYYWVLVKLLSSVFATFLLLLHQFTAVAAAAKSVSASALRDVPNLGQTAPQLVADAGVAVALLIGITLLSIFKPWGRTRFGQSLQQQRFQSPVGASVPARPAGLKVLLGILGLIATAVIALHLAGGGMARHGH